MKKTIIALGTLLLAGALPHTVKADTCCLDLDLEVGAEALYWKPCSCEWEYGFIDNSNDNVFAVLSNKPDYDWGFRIFGSYHSFNECGFLTLDWAHWRDTETVKVSAPEGLVINVSDSLSQVTAKQRLCFNRVNLRGGFDFYRGCNFRLYGYGGIRWIEIERKRERKGVVSDPEGPFNSRSQSKFWGVGIEAGAGAGYHLGCDIYLVGNAGFSAVVGERSYAAFTSTPNNTSTPSTRRTYPTTTSCLPGLDLRLGISYAYDCSCFSVSGEVGYEHMTYFRALRAAAATGFFSKVNCTNFGLGGPYASLKVRF